NGKAPWLLLAALAFGAWTWLPGAERIRWHGDELHYVYGSDFCLFDTFAGSFTGFHVTKWPVAWRPLILPSVSYLGGALGFEGTRIFGVFYHLACGAAFYSLLRRMAWAEGSAAGAVAFFLVSPWISQGALFLGGMSSVTVTFLIIAAAHCYLSWSRSD